MAGVNNCKLLYYIHLLKFMVQSEELKMFSFRWIGVIVESILVDFVDGRHQIVNGSECLRCLPHGLQ